MTFFDGEKEKRKVKAESGLGNPKDLTMMVSLVKEKYTHVDNGEKSSEWGDNETTTDWRRFHVL